MSLHFTETRTIFRPLESTTNDFPASGELSGPHSFAVALPIGGLPPGEAIDFEVSYIGEPISEPTVEFETGEWAEKSSNVRQRNFAASLPFVASPTSRNFDVRLAAIRNESQPDYRRASVFFAEYDNHPFPPLVRINATIPENERIVRLFVIMKAADIMRQRVMARGHAAQSGQIPAKSDLRNLRFVDDANEIDEPLTLEEVEYLSRIQRPIFERNHGNPVSQITVGEAF
ncbi:MAG: hypothetical protein EOP88_10250 [Verrucomicrobiaceae bacterium]|nr:MAG: hypothetical protein EOP88_10250 [Verrucomicrobiaceae bacterium]